MVSARRAAYDVLCDVRNGAYANLALKDHLPSVAPDDRAFCTALVYETLSRQITLDWVIGQFASSVKPTVRILLRLGACQLLYLHQPAHAAVNETVRLAKEVGKGALSGFVNGVLRKIDRERDALLPPTVALRCGWPDWLAARLVEDYGVAVAEATMEWCARREQRPLTLRVNTLRATVGDVMEELRALGCTVTVSRFSPDILLVSGFVGDIAQSPLFLSGRVSVQSEGSALICRVADPKPDSLVLDACAAPGGKTAALAALMKRGKILSCELHPHRAALIENTVKRLVTPELEVSVVTADSTQFRPEWEEKFDVVLVDAPCSGVGVVGTKPDLLLRLTAKNLDSLPLLQQSILHNCARYVRPGGALVYSTCTLLRRENAAVVKEFLSSCVDFSPDDITRYLPCGFDPVRAQDGMVQLLPGIDQTDGFFVCRMLKNAR